MTRIPQPLPALFLAILLFLTGRLPAGSDTMQDLAPVIRQQAESAFWTRNATPPPLTESRIGHALEAAREYFVAQQRPEGNFWYAVDLDRKKKAEEDNQVRQALATWGFAALCTARPTPATQKAVLRSLDFFFCQTQAHPSGAAVGVADDDIADEAPAGGDKVLASAGDDGIVVLKGARHGACPVTCEAHEADLAAILAHPPCLSGLHCAWRAVD